MVANTITDITNELERLTAFRAVTGDIFQTNLLFDYLETELIKLGLDVRRGAVKGYSNIVAGTKSTDKCKLLLQAHLDVVPAEPIQFRLIKDQDKLSGRGVYDMLFATAVYLVLLRELKQNDQLDQFDLGLMLTSDEEIGGFYGVGHLVKDYDCDVCFLPDAGSFKSACIKSKGVLMLEIESIGQAGHSSRPSQSKNPILPLAEFVIAVESKYPNADDNGVTCSVTQFQSGGASNQVPHAAKATLDIRFPAGENATEIQKHITQLATAYHLSVHQLELAMPFVADTDDPQFKSFSDCYKEVTGNELAREHNLGSSDARFFAEKGIPVIMIRPDGGDIHGEQEWVGAESLGKFYNVLKAYITKVAL